MRTDLWNKKKCQPTQISIHEIYHLNQLLFLALFNMVRYLVNNVLKMLRKKYFEAFLSYILEFRLEWLMKKHLKPPLE